MKMCARPDAISTLLVSSKGMPDFNSNKSGSRRSEGGGAILKTRTGKNAINKEFEGEIFEMVDQ
jgi:hypothetical protein